MVSSPEASIVHHFKDLKDPRIERTKKHRLIIDILVIALGSIMVGGDGFQDMELFGQSKREWLEGFLDLSNGIPSHDKGRVDQSSYPLWPLADPDVPDYGIRLLGTIDSLRFQRAVHDLDLR